MERRFSRIDSGHKANIEFFTDKYEQCQIQNLSLTGMFISGTFPSNTEKHCSVFLVQPGKTSIFRFQASAKVVRKTTGGVALEFISMTYESYMYLQIILLYEAEKPLDVMLELPDNCPFELIDQFPESPGSDN